MCVCACAHRLVSIVFSFVWLSGCVSACGEKWAPLSSPTVHLAAPPPPCLVCVYGHQPLGEHYSATLALTHIQIHSSVKNAAFHQLGKAAAGVVLALPVNVLAEAEQIERRNRGGGHHWISTRSGGPPQLALPSSLYTLALSPPSVLHRCLPPTGH